MNCNTCHEEITFRFRREDLIEANCGCRDWAEGEDAPEDWPCDKNQLNDAADNVRDSQ